MTDWQQEIRHLLDTYIRQAKIEAYDCLTLSEKHQLYYYCLQYYQDENIECLLSDQPEIYNKLTNVWSCENSRDFMYSLQQDMHNFCLRYDDELEMMFNEIIKEYKEVDEE